jgi:periplasmic protein TonB
VLIVLLMLPLVKPDSLPFLKPLPTPIALAAYRGETTPAQQPQHSNGPVTGTHVLQMFMQPRTFPTLQQAIQTESDAPPIGPIGSCDAPCTGTGMSDPNGVLGAPDTDGARPVLKPAPAPAPHVVHISHMDAGALIRRVQPEYPALARQARVQGQVLLAAVISKEGAIENLRVISGHPMLVRAAINAVKQWRYRPYILNGEPVEVETQIEVNFSLSGN